MFNDIESELLNRLRIADSILEYLSDERLTEAAKNSDFYRAQKGLVFVMMYAALEYSLTQSVARTLEIIEQEQACPSQFKNSLLCTVLDPHFKALRECGPNSVWEKRKSMVFAITEDSPIEKIDSSVFPSGGSMNISIQQIQNVWEFFEIQEELLPEGVLPFVISEVKEHRNAIAHGRETAINIGRRINISHIELRIQSIKLLCLHITSTFSDYCENKHYFTSAA